MRSERTHDSNVRRILNESPQRLSVFPRGKRPELSGEGMCEQRIAYQARRLFQLPHHLWDVDHEGKHVPNTFQRQIRHQRNIILIGIG